MLIMNNAWHAAGGMVRILAGLLIIAPGAAHASGFEFALPLSGIVVSAQKESLHGIMTVSDLSDRNKISFQTSNDTNCWGFLAKTDDKENLYSSKMLCSDGRWAKINFFVVTTRKGYTHWLSRATLGGAVLKLSVSPPKGITHSSE